MEMNQDPFKEYIRESEPNKREKGYAWQTAIGLQAVDGLKNVKISDRYCDSEYRR